MILTIYACFLVMLAGLPVAMMLKNLPLFTRATSQSKLEDEAGDEKVSVLIPARNEETSIRAALESILQYPSESLEVIVQDDCSEDRTAEIVKQVEAVDPRVRLVDAIPLPEGWNGKQHACWRLAKSAKHPWLLFLDADVRLSEDAIPRMLAHVKQKDLDLLSGFPRQETKTIAEKMLIPLMHFVLLGYLPIQQMRKSRSTSFSAGCGQLMLARSESYWACDGHRSIRATRHDGMKLPRAFRSHEMNTDIFDASDIAQCRMYHNRHQVVQGLLKNATEGIASNVLIIPFSILLGGAAILPVFSFSFAVFSPVGIPRHLYVLLAIASVLSWIPPCLTKQRFSQSWLAIILHPLSVAWFLSIQWMAWIRKCMGKKVTWRGRS